MHLSFLHSESLKKEDLSGKLQAFRNVTHETYHEHKKEKTNPRLINLESTVLGPKAPESAVATWQRSDKVVNMRSNTGRRKPFALLFH